LGIRLDHARILARHCWCRRPGIRNSAEVKDLMYVDLGGLRALKGSQRYPIPPASSSRTIRT
jgi:hypothetical protein